VNKESAGKESEKKGEGKEGGLHLLGLGILVRK